MGAASVGAGRRCRGATRVDITSLLTGVEVLAVQGRLDREVSSLVFHSDDVGPGACFIAVRGTTADGHSFIPEAVHPNRSFAALGALRELPCVTTHLAWSEPDNLNGLGPTLRIELKRDLPSRSITAKYSKWPESQLRSNLEPPRRRPRGRHGATRAPREVVGLSVRRHRRAYSTTGLRSPLV